jgi:hypothetical protein
MPKSKRAKVFHLTQVSKKGREQKDKLFENIRECIPQYQQCFVFSVDNMRNNYLKDVRRELSDCRCVDVAPLLLYCGRCGGSGSQYLPTLARTSLCLHPRRQIRQF